jgi:hypothetical protein
MKWPDSINRKVEKANAAFEDAAAKVSDFLLTKASRVLNRKFHRRFARLTLEQCGFFGAAFADALKGAQEKGYSNSDEHDAAIKIAEQTAWEKLYEQWPELRGKV